MANFTIVKKGYAPNEVDEYISKLEEIIKSYKDKDIAIKNAIISAQVAADNIIKNAELQAASYKLKAIEDLESIQDGILSQKDTLNTFKNDYDELIKKYLLTINQDDINILNQKIDTINKDFKKIHGKLVTQTSKVENKTS